MIFVPGSLIYKMIFRFLTALLLFSLYFLLIGFGKKMLMPSLANEAIVAGASNVQGIGCNYSISPASQAFPAAGGTGTITISAGPGCNWDAQKVTRNSPEPPRKFLDTTYPQPTGNSIFVAQGDDLQAALETAQPGDEISLEAGAVFTGNFILPAKQGDDWIVIRSSAPDSSLPAQGTRITPADAGQLPKIVTPNGLPALKAADGAHHYRLVALEITSDPAVQNVTNLILFGAGQTSYADLPHDLIVDRSYIHGHQGTILRRGLALNSASSAVIDSYISDCHEEVADSQAIIVFNSPGPLKIVNNYLEGAGENILFGGADPTIPNLVPSDIEFRNNHCYKPLSWKTDDPSYGGRRWAVKNSFELKNAQRILIDGNIFENNWADAQNGFAILFTVRNQDGGAPWSVVQDVTFTNNIVRHSGSGMNIHGTDDTLPSASTARIKIANNLFKDIDGSRWGGAAGMWLQIGAGPGDLTVVNNTAFQSGNISGVNNLPAGSGFVFANNLTFQNLYGFFGSDHGYGLPALDFYFPGYIFMGNIIVGGSAVDYPPGNFFPSTIQDIRFINYSGGDYRLSSTSPYKYAGVDERDIGCDIDLLEAAISGNNAYLPVNSPTFQSTSNWVTITSADIGSGNGIVNYSVAQNTGNARVATIIVAGRTFTITQNTSCVFNIDPVSRGYPPAGGSGSVAVTAADQSCRWVAQNPAGCVQITSTTNGTGSGVLDYVVPANNGPVSLCTIRVAGKNHTIAVDGIQYEGDVTPMPFGSGTIVVSDWVQVGRFSVGLDTAATGSEFQRADCAPRGTLGDGKITVADWVQAGRYSVGLDPATIAGGPSQFAMTLKREKKRDEPIRELRVAGNMTISEDGSVRVPVELVARGGESGMTFSLHWDSRILTFEGVESGRDVEKNATILLNERDLGSGRLGVGLALSPGRGLIKGTREVLMLKLRVLDRSASVAEINIGNGPTALGLADSDGNLLPVVAVSRVPLFDWLLTEGRTSTLIASLHR